MINFLCSFFFVLWHIDSIILSFWPFPSWFQNEPHFDGTNCYRICGMIATRSYRWISGNLSNRLSGPLAKQDSRVDMFQVFYWKTHLHMKTPDLAYIWQNYLERKMFECSCVWFLRVSIFFRNATWASRRYGWEAYEPPNNSTGHDKVATYTPTKQPQERK